MSGLATAADTLCSQVSFSIVQEARWKFYDVHFMCFCVIVELWLQELQESWCCPTTRLASKHVCLMSKIEAIYNYSLSCTPLSCRYSDRRSGLSTNCRGLAQL